MRRHKGLVTKCVTYYWLESDSEKQDLDTLSTWNNKHSYLQVYMGHITHLYFFLPLIASLEFPQHIQKCPLPFILSYLSRGKALDISIKMIFFKNHCCFLICQRNIWAMSCIECVTQMFPIHHSGFSITIVWGPILLNSLVISASLLALSCLIQLSGHCCALPPFCDHFPALLFSLSCFILRVDTDPSCGTSPVEVDTRLQFLRAWEYGKWIKFQRPGLQTGLLWTSTTPSIIGIPTWTPFFLDSVNRTYLPFLKGR